MEWSFLTLCLLLTFTLLPEQCVGWTWGEGPPQPKVLQVKSMMSSGSSCSSGNVRCNGDDDCIHPQYVCDGIQHCTDGSDEDQDLCSFWSWESSGSCSRGNIRCRHNCYSMWDACHTSQCSSDFRSGEMCNIVKNKELPQPFKGMKLASKLRKKRNTWSWGLNDDDEDLFEGSGEGSGIGVNNQDVETVNMLAKAVTSSLSESGCPMLYTRVANHCVSFFSLAQVPWPEARQFCQSIHGDLLTIEDIQLYVGLLDYLREKDLSSDFWLGGRYDMDLNNWCWLDDTPMPSNSPYWALRYSSTCQSRSLGGKCFNYIQLPEQHTQGYCAAITYETYFYISDEKCSLNKSPLCLFNMNKLN